MNRSPWKSLRRREPWLGLALACLLSVELSAQGARVQQEVTLTIYPFTEFAGRGGSVGFLAEEMPDLFRAGLLPYAWIEVVPNPEPLAVGRGRVGDLPSQEQFRKGAVTQQALPPDELQIADLGYLREAGIRFVLRGDLTELGQEIVFNAYLVDLQVDSVTYAQSVSATRSNVLQTVSAIASRIADHLRERVEPAGAAARKAFVVARFRNRGPSAADDILETLLPRYLIGPLEAALGRHGLDIVEFDVAETIPGPDVPPSVDALITGEFQAGEDSIAVTATMSERESAVAYSVTVRGSADDVFSLPGTVAERMAELIAGRLAPDGAWQASSALAADVATLSASAQRAARAGDHNEAILLYRTAVERDPTRAAAYVGLVELYRAQGEYEAARDVVYDARRAGVVDPELSLAAGAVDLEFGEYQRAIAEFEAALGASGQNRDLSLRANRELGTVHERLGNYQEAIRHFERALEFDRTKPEIYHSLSHAYRALGEFERAAQVLEEVRDITPDEPGLANDLAAIYNEMGDKYYGEGKPDEAEAQYQKTTSLDPPDEKLTAHALTYLGLIIADNRPEEDYEAGIVYARRAVAIDSTGVVAHRLLGYLHYYAGDHERSLASYERAVAIQPTAWTYAYMGNTLRLLGRYADAFGALERANAMDSNYEWPRRILGIAYKQANLLDSAIVALNDAIAVDTTKWSFAELGEVYRLKGQYDQALRSYGQALALDSTYAYPYERIGVVYREQDDYPTAVRWFERVLVLGDSVSAYTQLGETYRLWRQYDRAIGYLELAISIDPENEWPYRVLGVTYKDNEQYDKAMEMLEKAIALDPTKWAYGQLGDVHRLQKEYPQAIAVLQQAIALDSTYEAAYRRLGRAYRDSRDYVRAVAMLEKAVALRPTVSAYTDLGSAYRRQADQFRDRGDSARAGDSYALGIASLERAVALDTTNEWPHRVLGVLYNSMRKYDEAVEELQTAIALDPTKWAHAELAESYRMLGRYREASQAAGQAIAMDPEYDYPHATLADSRYRLGDYRSAIEEAKTAIKLDPRYEFAYRVLWRAYEKLAGSRGSAEDSTRVYREAASTLGELAAAAPRYALPRDYLAYLYHDFLFDYEAAHNQFLTILRLREPDVSTRANLAEARLTSGRFEEAYALADSLLKEDRAPEGRRLTIGQKLSMKLVIIASLVFQGKTNEADRELGGFIRNYRYIPDDYDQIWTYSGTKHFVETRSMDEASRSLLLELIDLLDSEKSEERIQRFEEEFLGPGR